MFWEFVKKPLVMFGIGVTVGVGTTLGTQYIIRKVSEATPVANPQQNQVAVPQA